MAVGVLVRRQFPVCGLFHPWRLSARYLAVLIIQKVEAEHHPLLTILAPLMLASGSSWWLPTLC